MLTYFDLRRGVRFILEGQPFEVLEFKQMGKAQDVVVAQTKVRNLITGKVIEKNFHQQDRFNEAELERIEATFIYSHKGEFWFYKGSIPSDRFFLPESVMEDKAPFLSKNAVLEALVFENKVINISLPIKMNLKVTEAPPGVKGDRSQGGNKIVVLETGLQINAPLFIKEGDTVEINTETKEYVRRI
jgi:elongation factor P